MNKNYYDQIYQKIQKLADEKKYEEALIKLKIELDLPYIPRAEEKRFINLFNKINQIVKSKEFKAFSIEQLLDMLNSNNNQQQAMALHQLEKINLHDFLPDLKKRFETWDKREYQALLFELMHQQKINVDLKIDDQIINPFNESFMLYPQTIETLAFLQKLTFQKPQYLEIANQLFSKYLLTIFPQKIIETEQLAKDIYALVDNFFENSFLNKRQEQLKKQINS